MRGANLGRRAAGFTLMEVMVAITIFALIGVASYRMLSAVASSDERLARNGELLAGINRALWLLGQDLEQMVARPVRDGGGQPQPWLQLDINAELPLQFTRGGRANPLQLPRSTMQRVAWQVALHPEHEDPDSPYYNDEKRYLLRYVWPMLDGAGARETALVQVVLPEVEAVEVAVRSKNGSVLNSWPDPAAPEERPVAVQIKLQHAQLGAVERWYRVL